MKALKYLIISLCLYCDVSNAQDTHYWTNQFGPRGSILGNSVMGSIYDHSAIYYNPGFFGFVDSGLFSISASIYQYDMLNVIDGAGEGINLKSNQTQILPSIISGTFKLKNAPRHKFGYTVLTKHQTGIKTSARVDGEFDILPEYNNPGNEEFIGQFSLKSGLNEQWIGGAYSYAFSEHFSVGTTLFGAYRSQDLEYSYNAKVIPPTLSDYSLWAAPIISYSDFQSISMTTMRGFAKIGIAFNYDRIDFGLTYTTSSISLYNSAVALRDEHLNNINDKDLNFTEYTQNAVTYEQYVMAADEFRFELNQNTFTVNDRQSSSDSRIRANFKSPMSVGFAFALKSKSKEHNQPRQKLLFALEYFNRVAPYYLLEPESRGVIRPRRDNYPYTSIDFMGIEEEYRSLINFSIGYERKINEKLRLLAGFRTNNSYLAVENLYSDVLISQTFWNIWHYSIGAIYKKKRSEISIGLNYGDGLGLMDPYIIMTNVRESNFLSGDNYTTLAKFKTIGITLGYNYFFQCTD